jgi:hypothetical protein
MAEQICIHTPTGVICYSFESPVRITGWPKKFDLKHVKVPRKLEGGKGTWHEKLKFLAEFAKKNGYPTIDDDWTSITRERRKSKK